MVRGGNQILLMEQKYIGGCAVNVCGAAAESPPAESRGTATLVETVLSVYCCMGIGQNGDQTSDNLSQNPPHRLLLRILGKLTVPSVYPCPNVSLGEIVVVVDADM